MSARHSTSHPRRNPAARKIAIFGAVAVAVVLIAGLLVSVFTRSGGGLFCGSSIDVSIAAEPSIVGQVQVLVDQAANESCADFTVSAVSSADFQKQVREGVQIADIWVPDSVARLDQVSQDAQIPFDKILNSIASTPVIVATSGEASVDLYSWTTALRTDGLKLGDPISAGVADAAILAGTSEVEKLTVSKTQLEDALVLLAQGQAGRKADSPTERELLDAIAADGGAAVVSESEVVRYQDANPDSGVTARPPKTGAVFLTFPMAVTSQDATRREEIRHAASDLTTAATSDDFHKSLSSASFRLADRSPLDNGRGAGEIEELIVRDAQTLDTALKRWEVLALPTRANVLVDGSGSMSTIVPGTTKNRMELVAETALLGLDLFPDNAALGGWIYGADRTPDGRSYEVMAPLRKLGEATGARTHREVMREVITALPEHIGGGTDLYSSLLGAYREALKEYDPAAVNAIILFTDGANDNVSPLSREQFNFEMQKILTPSKPISVVLIGILEDADPATLADIAQMTLGKTFIAKTAEEIPQVFASAMGNRGK